MDVEYFPFDEQTCVMKFGSWTYDGFQVYTEFRIFNVLKVLEYKDQKSIMISRRVSKVVASAWGFVAAVLSAQAIVVSPDYDIGSHHRHYSYNGNKHWENLDCTI